MHRRDQALPSAGQGGRKGGETIEPGGFDFSENSASNSIIQRQAGRLHRRFGLSLIAAGIIAAEALRASRVLQS